MFQVQASTLDEYLDADPARKSDLQAFDSLIRETVPRPERWFYAGAAAGRPGMRMKLIGYGSFQYEVKPGLRVEWPIIGLALQKNYITLYTSVRKDGVRIHAVAVLLRDIGETVERDPRGSLEYGTYRIVSSSVQAAAG